jgi:hypothetical protein
MSYCALSATGCVTEFASLGSRKKMGIVHPFPVNVFINSLSDRQFGNKRLYVI